MEAGVVFGFGISRKRFFNALVYFNHLIHCILVLEKRFLLTSWVVVLSITTFTLSMSGTFLVRSGILNSVHTFANDLREGCLFGLFILLNFFIFIDFFLFPQKKLKITTIFFG